MHKHIDTFNSVPFVILCVIGHSFMFAITRMLLCSQLSLQWTENGKLKCSFKWEVV